MLDKTHPFARFLCPRLVTLAGLTAMGAAVCGVHAGPVERVWANGIHPFRGTAIDEVISTGSSARRTVTVAHHINGGYIYISVWDEAGWETGVGIWGMQGVSRLEPTSVREISTGEFLVSGTAVVGNGLTWFVAIFDPMLLQPRAFVASGYGGSVTPMPVLADETSTGDIVVAANSFGRVQLLSLPRSTTDPTGFDLPSRKVAFLASASGDPVSVDAMRVSPSGSIVMGGARSVSFSRVAYLATINPTTLAPIAATEYPEINPDAWFSSLWTDGTTVYAAGAVTTPHFPSFLTSARVISVPESLSTVNWDRTYTTSVIPADIRGAVGTSGTDLWLAGATPSAHANGLMRLDESTGLPLTFSRFRSSELSALTGLAIDHSGAQPVPVAVGHWRSGPVAPNPIYGLFVRGDANGTTECSSFLPLGSAATPVTQSPLQLVDVTPNPWIFTSIAWPWNQGTVIVCFSVGPPTGPDPHCPGFTACQPPCRIDLTGDGTIDFFDLVAFINFYQAAHPAADFDDNGVLNFFDFAAYLTEFQIGCL